jgi:hypothetical protein
MLSKSVTICNEMYLDAAMHLDPNLFEGWWHIETWLMFSKWLIGKKCAIRSALSLSLSLSLSLCVCVCVCVC